MQSEVKVHVQKLVEALKQNIVQDMQDTAKDALWDYIGYTGPGISETSFFDGYLLNVLEWYQAAYEAERSGIDIPTPPPVRIAGDD